MRSNSSLALKVDVTKVYTSLALLTAMNMEEEEEVFGGAQKASKCSFSSHKMHYFFLLSRGWCAQLPLRIYVFITQSRL